MSLSQQPFSSLFLFLFNICSLSSPPRVLDYPEAIAGFLATVIHLSKSIRRSHTFSCFPFPSSSQCIIEQPIAVQPPVAAPQRQDRSVFAVRALWMKWISARLFSSNFFGEVAPWLQLWFNCCWAAGSFSAWHSWFGVALPRWIRPIEPDTWIRGHWSCCECILSPQGWK